MIQPAPRPALQDRPLPLLRELLHGAACIGAALVLTVPAARGYHDWLGWMPLWLLGMPLASLWALNRFSLPWRLLPARTRPRRTPGLVPGRARSRRRAGMSSPLHRAA